METHREFLNALGLVFTVMFSGVFLIWFLIQIVKAWGFKPSKKTEVVEPPSYFSFPIHATCGQRHPVGTVCPELDVLDRCAVIRKQVAELEKECERLIKEHNELLGSGTIDEEDIAWAKSNLPIKP